MTEAASSFSFRPDSVARTGLFGLLLTLLLWVSAPSADDAEEIRNRLIELRDQIADIQQQIRAAETERDELDDELAVTEREISAVTRELKRLQTQIGSQNQRLAGNQREQDGLNASIQEEAAALAAQVRSAYALGQHQFLKMVINQDDPAAMGRSLSYYRYFNRERVRRIDRIQGQLVQLDNLIAEQLRVRESMQKNELQLIAERQGKQALQDERKVLLARIAERIQSSQSELGSLDQDQKRLQKLLAELEDIFADIPNQIDHAPDFISQKSRLAWPVQGDMYLAPGSNKPGGMNRMGAVIKAAKGTQIKALSYGRVAYSDWLRGFGLLIIIDHGEGYLSLYGFNEALFKDVGDWVNQDEVIGTVGDNSLIADSGLYFEIRKDGKPVNPRPWIRELP